METYLIEFNTFEKPKILKILEALDIKFSKINAEIANKHSKKSILEIQILQLKLKEELRLNRNSI
jgi:hypothetical protein